MRDVVELNEIQIDYDYCDENDDDFGIIFKLVQETRAKSHIQKDPPLVHNLYRYSFLNRKEAITG